MKPVILGLCLAVWAAGAGAQDSPPRDEVFSARVSRVSDGDTLWVKPIAGGAYRKLRLDGIDAPEICQPGGEAARDVLARRVLRQVVEVRVRAEDDYGRGLARIVHQGDDVGAWMVGEGQAWSYHWRSSRGPFAAEEASARVRRRGVFADATAEPPRTFRKRHGPCPLPPRSGQGGAGSRG